MTCLCRCTFLSVIFAVAFGVSMPNHTTPVGKVITLLEDLKATVQSEEKAEAKIYDEFGCFCKDDTKTKSDSIMAAQDTIDAKSATIAQKTAEKEGKEEELFTEKQTLEDANKELDAKKVQFQKDTDTYNAKNLDLQQALHACDKALTSLKTAEDAAKAGAALLELGKTVHSSLHLQRVVNLLQPHQLQDLSALLQEGVDPLDPSYKFHSGGIISLITDLQTQFTSNKADLDTEWDKTKTTFESEKSALELKISTTEANIGTLESEIETLETEIGEAKEDLVSAEFQLKEDSAYLHDLTVRCETRAREWDQRSTMRTDEIAALDQALTILKDTVKDLDTKVNKRAVEALVSRVAPHTERQNLPSKPAATAHATPVTHRSTKTTNSSHAQVGAAKAMSFLQAHASKTSSKRFLAAVQTHVDEAQKDRVLDFLRSEGRRLGSTMLSTTAGRIEQMPMVNKQMDKVKSLIMNLLDRLLQESTAEATKKGYCDTELAKTEHDRKERFLAVKSLNADLAALEAKKDALTAEIEELKNAINNTKESLTSATTIRAQEKATNNETVHDATEGFKAVVEAIGILKEFYKTAAKATTSLLQTSASPIEENITEGGALVGAYTGSQANATNIFALLEVIKDDFDRTIRTTEAAEREAQAEFVLFERTSLSSIKAKETQQSLSTQDLTSTQNAIDTGMVDLQNTQDLLDDDIKTIEGMKQMCIDTTMSYKERKAAREAEIAALKKAHDMLLPQF